MDDYTILIQKVEEYCVDLQMKERYTLKMESFNLLYVKYMHNFSCESQNYIRLTYYEINETYDSHTRKAYLL